MHWNHCPHSPESALFEPMAALMIGGLAIASILTLFFVPCGYYLFFRSYRLPWQRQQAPVSADQTAEQAAETAAGTA